MAIGDCESICDEGEARTYDVSNDSLLGEHWLVFSELLSRRFDILHGRADIDRSLQAGANALNALPRGHASTPNRLANLAAQYFKRFEEFSNRYDSNEEGSDKELSCWAELASVLHSRAAFGPSDASARADLERAVELGKRRLNAYPVGSAERASPANNLGIFLLHKMTSTLLTQDWRDDPLTVKDLMALKLYRNPPLLAYLSACSTGSTGADDLADEGLYLMSACQLVGFRHVVGSLWAVSDRHCVDVAQTLYATMVAGNMGDDSVSLGLRDAVRDLQNNKTKSAAGGGPSRQGVGPADLDDCLWFGRDPRVWAAYVHMGP